MRGIGRELNYSIALKSPKFEDIGRF